jgi:nitroreductase
MRRLVVVVTVVVLGGCSARSADPGVAADLQVAGGSFTRGALPSPSPSGPGVQSLQLPDVHVAPGEQNRPLLGALDPSATAVLLALDGDRGYWVVGAGVPATDAPMLPTFSVRLGFARTLADGPRRLVAQAVDAAGHVGPPSTQTLDIAAAALPSGPLVVSLSWTVDADLDLHVVDPDGVEIFSRHPSGYRPPPPPGLPDPTAAMNAPLLDGDSNAACAIDGRDVENVVWKLPPQPGHYVVRVDATSLCGLPYADWSVSELVGGAVVATARGEAIDADTRGAHDQGAGRTALEFDVP